MGKGILLLLICAFIACYRVNFTFTTHKPVYSVTTGQNFKVYDRLKLMSHNFKTFHTSLDCTTDFRTAFQKLMGTTLEILGATPTWDTVFVALCFMHAVLNLFIMWPLIKKKLCLCVTYIMLQSV